ncbi:hypothetical protein GCM10027258_62690 [Amycolatopsis stemonae]
MTREDFYVGQTVTITGKPFTVMRTPRDLPPGEINVMEHGTGSVRTVRLDQLDDGARPAPADPDKPCPHTVFIGDVQVGRLTETDDGPVIAFSADIKIKCAQCDEPFRFMGLPAGILRSRPAVSIDETELRAPIRPASSDPDFGLGIPGFSINYREGPR